MALTSTSRPRNVNSLRAAAILYGDWGTSKAYVLGLAFALAGHSSFWLIAAVSILMALIGYNYITICKFSPYGGGVYSDAKKKSGVLALIGAFFLISDYIITAALSSLSCFYYLGVSNPEFWAITSIFIIGFLNYFGPRHTGNLAVIIGLATVVVVVILALVSIPYFGYALQSIEAPKGSFIQNWDYFISIIIALSGVESIANATGIMQLDPESTTDNPSVHQTSKKSIFWVLLEVCIFTALLGFMMNAIPGLEVVNGQVNAPGDPNVRDYMLKYMGEFFVSHSLSPMLGVIFGNVIGFVFAILLLSAVNTAVMSLVSLLFVMSRDGELPAKFQKMSNFGVPIFPLILATLSGIFVLFFVHDIGQLANLYAVGFVGAIATHLGTTVFDRSLKMTKTDRYLMLIAFVIMVLIEISLLIVKPDARRFALTVLTFGLILRAFVIEQRQRQWESKKIKPKHASLYADDTQVPLHYGAIMCAVRTIGKTLNYSLQEAKLHEQPLYILYVREQKVITEEDKRRTWLDDETACEIFDYAKESSHEMVIKFFYAVSDSPGHTIVEFAEKLHISRLVIGRPRHSVILNLLRGNIVEDISQELPSEIDLVIIS